MALESSGAMSLGGATTGRSVNLELGCSATAQIGMNDTAARTLAGVASGAIAMSDFYGKSSGPPAPTSLGTYYPDFGGYYAGTQGGYYLFASSASANGYQWKTTLTNSPGTGSTTDGYSNTYAQVNATHPLFNYVGGLTTAGFSDWYVSSCGELQTQYNNRASVGGYPSHYTWSSTESSRAGAHAISFTSGCWFGAYGYGRGTKTLSCNCSRPIRRC